jgi:hypothetical protein
MLARAVFAVIGVTSGLACSLLHVGSLDAWCGHKASLWGCWGCWADHRGNLAVVQAFCTAILLE